MYTKYIYLTGTLCARQDTEVWVCDVTQFSEPAEYCSCGAA